jgi:hypothetical protein
LLIHAAPELVEGLLELAALLAAAEPALKARTPVATQFDAAPVRLRFVPLAIVAVRIAESPELAGARERPLVPAVHSAM